MKKGIFYLFVLLCLLCACEKKGGDDKAAPKKRPASAVVAKKKPVKKTAGEQRAPKNFSYDSLGAVTDLVFRCDYAKLAARPCFDDQVVLKRLKTEKDNADLYFALALKLPENSLEREAQLKKAAALQPEAPYPLLELMCYYGNRGDFKKAKEAAGELTEFFGDKDLPGQVIKRCGHWLKGYAVFDDTFCNDSTAGVAEILAPYSQKLAQAVVKYHVVCSNERRALQMIEEWMDPQNDREKLAWLEILECIDDPAAQELINRLGELPERDSLSVARARITKLQREQMRGNFDFIGEEYQDLRRQILLYSTNSEERLEVAWPYLSEGLMSDDHEKIDEYFNTLVPADSDEKLREFSVLLENMGNNDMEDEAVRYAMTLYVSAPTERQPAVLAKILQSELTMDDDLIREAAGLHPKDIKLIRAIGDYYQKRKNYAEAAEWHKKLLALMKTEPERNAARALLAEDLAALGDKAELMAFFNDSEEALGKELDAAAKTTLFKIRLGLEGTNQVWQEAAEAFLSEQDPDGKAVLLDFLTSFQWNTVKNTVEMAPAVTAAALAEPTSPEILKILPALFERLEQVEARKELRELMAYFLRQGIKPPYFYETLTLFPTREEALRELKDWIKNSRLGSLDLIDFYTSAICYRLGVDKASLELYKAVWEATGDLNFRQRSSLFYCFYNFSHSDKLEKEDKDSVTRTLFEAWYEDFRNVTENDIPAIAMPDPGDALDQATEAEKREILDLITAKLKRSGTNYTLVNIFRKLIKDLGREKEGFALLEEHFSFDYLVKNPGEIWLYSNICDEMGKEFDKKKVLREIVASRTNLNSFAQSGLIYFMRECGLKKEADELCEKLLDEPGIPWYLKQTALYNIKNQDKRLEKTLEIAAAMPPGEGKNELYFQVLNNCRGEKWKEDFKEAWEYLQTSKKDYVWERLLMEVGNSPYDLDPEKLFENYEKFLSEKKDKEEVAKIIASSRLDFYTSQGDYDKAAKVGEDLVLKDPGRGGDLADLYLRAGHSDKAQNAYKNLLDAYEKACQDGDTSHKDWLTRAVNGLKEMCQNGQAELDEQTLRRVFLRKDDPGFNDYLEFAGAAQGIAEASSLNDCYEKALEKASGNDKNYVLDEWINCAKNYGDTNAYKKALALKAEDDLNSMADYMRLLESQGEEKEAFEKGWAAWEKSKESGDNWSRRGLENQLFEMCVKAGEKDKAWEILSEKWKPDQKDSYVYLDVMGILNQAQKLEKGREAVDSLAKYIETSGNAYSKLSNAMGVYNAYKKLGDQEAAMKFVDEFLEKTPKSSGHPTQRLDLVFNSSHPEKGLELVKDAIENDESHNLGFYLSKASAYFDQRKDPEGKIEFLRSLPEGYDQRVQLSAAYKNSGDEKDLDKAKDLLKENLRDDEVDSYQKQNSRNQLLDLALRGEKDKYLLNDLVNDYNSDETLSKEERNRGLADLYSRSEDYVKADNVYNQWLTETKDPREKADIRKQYAAMLEKSGRSQEAIEQFQEIMKTQKNDPDALNGTREELIRLYTAQEDRVKVENIRRERIAEYEKILASVPYGSRAREVKAKLDQERKALEEGK